MNTDKEQILKRILFLETVGVGCGPVCTCRAYVAASLTDSQAALLEEESRAVVFNHKTPVEEAGVLALLGDTVLPQQTEGLGVIARDKRLPDRRPTEKGGVQGAEAALEDMLATARLSVGVLLGSVLERVFGGDLDPANMSDDDIRNAAYDK